MNLYSISLSAVRSHWRGEGGGGKLVVIQCHRFVIAVLSSDASFCWVSALEGSPLCWLHRQTDGAILLLLELMKFQIKKTSLNTERKPQKPQRLDLKLAITVKRYIVLKLMTFSCSIGPF